MDECPCVCRNSLLNDDEHSADVDLSEKAGLPLERLSTPNDTAGILEDAYGVDLVLANVVAFAQVPTSPNIDINA